MANDVSRPGWWKALQAWAPALLWSLVIFWLSAIPGDALPRMPGWWNADKLIHGAVYAVLGAAVLVRRARDVAARPWPDPPGDRGGADHDAVWNFGRDAPVLHARAVT